MKIFSILFNSISVINFHFLRCQTSFMLESSKFYAQIKKKFDAQVLVVQQKKIKIKFIYSKAFLRIRR